MAFWRDPCRLEMAFWKKSSGHTEDELRKAKKKIDPEAEVKLSNGSTDGGKSYVVWILKPKL